VRNTKHHSKNTVYLSYQEKCNLTINETAQIPDSDSMHCVTLHWLAMAKESKKY